MPSALSTIDEPLDQHDPLDPPMGTNQQQRHYRFRWRVRRSPHNKTPAKTRNAPVIAMRTSVSFIEGLLRDATQVNRHCDSGI
jgi:hypothetical protein